jgi:eukaryotic-like serine/threonine-protein kinase
MRRSLRLSHSLSSGIAACLLLCATASATPSISLSRNSGPPTIRILVSGTAFDPNVQVKIYFDSTDEGQTTTDGNGDFGKAIHVPRSALPGNHAVKAVDADNESAQHPFLVRTNWGQYHRLDMSRFNQYENVLNEKNVGKLQLQWQFQTGGDLYSSAAVSNGVVYVGSEDYNLYALDAATGAELWSFNAGNGFCCAPAVSNGVVYAGPEDGGMLFALNANTGAKVWSYQANGAVRSSPAIVGGVLYVGTDGGGVSDENYFYAFNAATGAVLWTFRPANGDWGNAVDSSPAVVDGVVYFGSNDYNVYAVDAKAGTKLWSFATGYLVYSSPSVVNGVVYIGSSDSNVYALNAKNGKKLWKFHVGSDVTNSPAVANGVVYIGDGNIYALNARTGKLLWRRMGFWSSGTSSPAVANGIVYLASGEGVLYALRASDGDVLWSYTLSKNYYISSSPTVVNGMLFILSGESVYAFGLPNSGKQPISTLRNPVEFNHKTTK